MWCVDPDRTLVVSERKAARGDEAHLDSIGIVLAPFAQQAIDALIIVALEFVGDDRREQLQLVPGVLLAPADLALVLLVNQNDHTGHEYEEDQRQPGPRGRMPSALRTDKRGVQCCTRSRVRSMARRLS